MRKISSFLLLALLCSVTMSITSPQVNEPVKIGIEKIAKAPPGNVATCPNNCLSDNPALMAEEFRLISDYETTGTPTKPLALVMASTTSVATDLSVLMNRSLFLPKIINQVEESPPV